MSCCNRCGCQPCSCNYTVIIGGESGGGGSGITNGVNVNSAGIGVLDAFNANTLYFRGVESGSAALTAALNATNHTILLTLDISAIAAALPQATTTQAGVGETATDAEAQSKVSTTVFLTPSNLAALGASATFAGFIEIATDAEAISGTSTSLAIVPSSLAAVLATGPGRQTFADAVGRAAATPDFIGQQGYQLDTQQTYVGYGAAPGLWNALLTDGITNDLTGFSITTGSVTMFSKLQINTGGIIDFFGGTIEIGGAAVPAANVLMTSLTPGDVTSYPISNFISTANVQTGWSVTNPSVSRTLDVAAATLGDVRAVLGTLINDLKAVLLPAT